MSKTTYKMYQKYTVRLLNREYTIWTDFAGLDMIKPKDEALGSGLGRDLWCAVLDYFEDMGHTDLGLALRDLHVEVLEQDMEWNG